MRPGSIELDDEAPVIQVNYEVLFLDTENLGDDGAPLVVERRKDHKR